MQGLQPAKTVTAPVAAPPRTPAPAEKPKGLSASVMNTASLMYAAMATVLALVLN